MEFKGTKGEWQMSNVKNESDCNNTSIYCEKGNTIAVVNWYKRTACFDLNYGEEVAVVRSQGDYNALLISKAPILLHEHYKDLEFLEKIAKQLDQLDGFLEQDVLDRIEFKKQLIKQATEL